MSVAKANKGKYKEDYIGYGVACLQKDGEYIPQGYVVHENTGQQLFEIPPQAAFEQRSQGATQQNRLSRLLYSKSKEGCLKRVRLDAGRAQVNLCVEASYVVALRIAKAKKS